MSFEKLSAEGGQVEWLPLRELAEFRNGKGHEKDIVPNGQYVVVNSKYISTDGEVVKYTNTQICPLFKNDICLVMSDLPNGKALAKCRLIDENDKYSLNQRIGAFVNKDDEKLINKYLFYILNRNPQLLRYDNGTDQTNLKKDEILNISIPVPTKEIQERIVYVLDNFDAVCNDLKIGLPAEIEARQKQYEYYRNKLLCFNSVSGIGIERERERGLAKLRLYIFGYSKVKVRDVASAKRGTRVVRNQLSDNDKYAVYQNSMTPLGYYGSSNCIGGTAFVICAGAAGEI